TACSYSRANARPRSWPTASSTATPSGSAPSSGARSRCRKPSSRTASKPTTRTVFWRFACPRSKRPSRGRSRSTCIEPVAKTRKPGKKGRLGASLFFGRVLGEKDDAQPRAPAILGQALTRARPPSTFLSVCVSPHERDFLLTLPRRVSVPGVHALCGSRLGPERKTVAPRFSVAGDPGFVSRLLSQGPQRPGLYGGTESRDRRAPGRRQRKTAVRPCGAVGALA